MTEERTGRLFILVGPGGVGKNALMKEVLQQTDTIRQLPTATTRAARPGEQDGREHEFVSVEEFEQMIQDGELLEHQEVHPGKYYGVPRKTVESAIYEKRDLIADIEVKGAAILAENYPDNIVSVFVVPPSVESLVERLNGRGASSIDITDRINRFPMEMLYAPLTDYVIVNDDVNDALDELNAIISASRFDQDYGVVNEISYCVTVAFKQGESYYCLSNSDQCVYTKRFDPGQLSDQVAQKVASEVLGDNAKGGCLYYRHILGTAPITIDYAPSQNTCCLTYHYVYELNEDVVMPADWVQVSADDLEVGERC